MERPRQPAGEERVDVEALMEEVRRKVDERRARGEYGRLDDQPAFDELAQHDELAASANRVGEAADIPGAVAKLYEDGEDRRPGAIARFGRRVVGARISFFMERVLDFMGVAADNSRVAAERIVALERRVAELEGERAAGGESGPGETSETPETPETGRTGAR